MAAHVFSGRSLVMISFKFPASGSLPVIFISLINYNIHVSTMRAIIQKWKGYGVVTNLPRKGRPRKLDKRAERLITRKVMQKPFTKRAELHERGLPRRTRMHSYSMKCLTNCILDNVGVGTLQIPSKFCSLCKWLLHHFTT